MKEANQRRRGGQIGNQNARKHGFYSQMPIRKEDRVLPLAQANIDHNIAVLRVKISSILQEHPDNVRLLTYAESLLQRLIRTKRLMQRRRREKARSDAERLGRSLSVTPKTSRAGNSPC